MNFRATLIITTSYCVALSYYVPNTGLKTFHSLTHLILIKPYEVDVVIMPFYREENSRTEKSMMSFQESP